MYFQVRTCAAPCVGKSPEEEYRKLAGQVAHFLASPWERPADVAAQIPAWVGAETGSRGVVVERTAEGLELHPVRDWAVLDEAVVRAPEAELDDALGRLRWDAPIAPRDDRAWLLSWLHAPRRQGVFVPLWTIDDPAAIAVAVRAALGMPAADASAAPS